MNNILKWKGFSGLQIGLLCFVFVIVWFINPNKNLLLLLGFISNNSIIGVYQIFVSMIIGVLGAVAINYFGFIKPFSKEIEDIMNGVSLVIFFRLVTIPFVVFVGDFASDFTLSLPFGVYVIGILVFIGLGFVINSEVRSRLLKNKVGVGKWIKKNPNGFRNVVFGVFVISSLSSLFLGWILFLQSLIMTMIVGGVCFPLAQNSHFKKAGVVMFLLLVLASLL